MRYALGSAAVAALSGVAHGAQVTWTDTVGGLWLEHYRWSSSPDLPGAGDDVVIDVASGVVQVKVNGVNVSVNSLTSQENILLESGELSLDSASTVYGSFDFTGGLLTGSGDLTLAGASTWVNATTMSGSGRTIVASTGTMTITPGNYNKTLQRGLVNFGTIDFVAPAGTFGSIGMTGATIENKAGATFVVNHDTDASFFGDAGTNVVVNDGTWIKEGTGAVTFGGSGSLPVAFVNRGVVDVRGGTLVLQTGTNHTGAFSVSSGASLRFEGGHAFAAAGGVSGAGDVTFNHVGDNTSDGAFNVTGTVLFTGNTTNTFNGAFHAGTLLAPNGGTYAFNGTATVGQATLNNMTISGGGDFAFLGDSTWSGFGTMSGSGRTVVAPGVTLALVGGASEKNIQRRLVNGGTIDWGGGNTSASLLLTDATIENQAGATFNATGHGYGVRGVSGTNAFLNAGVFNKSGTGTATFGGNGTSVVQFANGGTVNVSAGTLAFTGGFTNTGVVNLSGGTMTLGAGLNNAGGQIRVTGGVLNLGGQLTTGALGAWQNTVGASVNLLGILDNAGATLALDANTGSLAMAPGSRIEGGTLTTAGGAALEIGGTAQLDGLSLAGAVLIRATNATVLNGLTLTNGATLTLASDGDTLIGFTGSQAIGGTGTVTTGGSSGAVVTLAPNAGDTLTIGAGVLVKPGTRDLVVGSGSAGVVVQGTLLADLAGRMVTVTGTAVTNLGTFEAKDGGAVVVTGGLTNLSGGTLTGGTWRVSADGVLRVAGANVTTNAAHVVLDGASANFFNGSGTVSALANLSVNGAAGDLRLLNGYSFSGTSGFANLGRLTVGAGSTWTTPGQFANGGTATIGGALSTVKTVNDGRLVVGGTHDVSGDLVVGSAKAGAVYELNGGALTVGGFATVGAGPAGAGAFEMTGGTFAVGKQLYVSTAGTNTSTFTMSGGAVTAGELFVAFFGGSQGVFTQAGGTVTLTGSTAAGTTGALTIGLSTLAATSGTYHLSGGTLTNQGAQIGFGGSGTFNQTGGTHTVAGPAGLSLSEFLGGTGTYALGDGAVLNVSADERVGDYGTGVFNQTGGSHTVGGAVTIGANAGASGAFNLSGGTLTAGAVNLVRGSFNQTGGTLAATTFSHSGGTVTGTLGNAGTYVYNGGVFGGRLVNSGTVVLNADFTAGNGLDNRSAFAVASNRAVVLNGLGLENSGTFEVAGSVTAPVTVNDGTFAQSGGLAAVGVLTSTGTITRGGGTFTASATVNHGAYVQTGGVASLGNVSGTGSVSVSGGTLGAGRVRQGALSVSGYGVVNLAAGSGVSVVKALNVATGTGGAGLELADNALVVDYDGASVIGDVRGMVAGGYGGTSAAHWTGSGVRSSVAAGDATLGLAVAEASVALAISGTATASWMGETVDASSVLVRLTKLGDSNFDGTVGFGDFMRLEVGFGKAGGWTDGDFNYDGFVDHADFMLLYHNFGQTVGAAPAPVAGEDLRTLAFLGAQVPEPSGLGVLGVVGAVMGRRRRRR